MLKNILKLDGVQELNKTEQKNIAGGTPMSRCLRTCQRYGGGIGCYHSCGIIWT